MANDSDLERIAVRAGQVLHPGEIQNWLRSPNPFIPGNATPLAAIHTGHLDDVLGALDAEAENTFPS